MNRIQLFLLFIVFLLIPLSAPVFSSVVLAVQLGCDGTAVQEPAGGRDCNALATAVLTADAGATTSAATIQAAAPLGLQGFIEQDQAEGHKQWLFLAIIAVLVLWAARIAPSMK